LISDESPLSNGCATIRLLLKSTRARDATSPAAARQQLFTESNRETCTRVKNRLGDANRRMQDFDARFIAVTDG
jgi:hypothetical protein